MSAAENDQVTAEQLKTMSPEQIVQAQNDGRLDSLLSGLAAGAKPNG
jgi:hypothetical protein